VIDLWTPVIAAPVIIVAARSPSSEADGAGRRWLSYGKIPTLKQSLVLSQDERVLQVHSGSGDLRPERFVSSGAIELDGPPVTPERGRD
jgi:hypothetical protein